MALKRLGIRRVIARSRNDLHGEVLHRIGADQVVYPERDMGYQLAHSFYSKSVLDYIDLGPEVGITKLRVPPDCVGKSPEDLGLESTYELAVVAIERGREIVYLPPAGEPLREADEIVVMGRDEQLDRFLNEREAERAKRRASPREAAPRDPRSAP
jgi:trk system potassium uptake protein TrkA